MHKVARGVCDHVFKHQCSFIGLGGSAASRWGDLTFTGLVLRLGVCDFARVGSCWNNKKKNKQGTLDSWHGKGVRGMDGRKVQAGGSKEIII